MTFLKYTLATIFGLILFSFLSLILLIGIGSAASSSEKVEITQNSMLQLNFDTQIKEKEDDNPFEDLNLDFMSSEDQMGLKEIKECIQRAADDDNIKGIYLNLNGMNAGLATSKEIRNELKIFKESGKPVIAYSEYFSEGAYYLASISDKILLHPMGNVEFNGFSQTMMFFKGSLDKLDVQAEVIKVGKYKSFAEPFVREDMSPENKEQMEYLVYDLYNEFLSDISESRGLNKEELKVISNEHRIRLAKHALENKLVDQIVERDEAMAILKNSVELDSTGKLSLVSYNNYKKSESGIANTSSNKIAILVAEGEIRMGSSEDGILGASTFVRELKKLREDSGVKAIVLRVNSPGGSAVASQLMEREIQLTREEKPVIASMSDLAASGGYWISMGCDKIVAQPNSITGSIGVIGLMFNVQDFLKNKLGISIDQVKTGDFADIGNGLHSMTDEERAIIQEGVDDIYKDFTSKVANYRNLNIDTVLDLAGGRVWTGNQALEIGLVDDLGGLQKAVEIAAEMSELKDYRIRYYPPKEDFFKQIFDGKAKEEFVTYLVGEPNEFQKLFQTLEKIKKSEGILARLPYGIEFKY